MATFVIALPVVLYHLAHARRQPKAYRWCARPIAAG
jgi:hypothetical protein